MGAIKTLFQCNHMDMDACFYANKLWWWMHIHPISEITSIKLILSGKCRGECRRNWVFSSAKLSPQGDTVDGPGLAAGSTDCSHVSEISCDISVTGATHGATLLRGLTDARTDAVWHLLTFIAFNSDVVMLSIYSRDNILICKYAASWSKSYVELRDGT